MELSGLSTFWSYSSLNELSRNFSADARLGSCSIWSPLAKPRTPSIGVSSRVRVGSRGQTHGKIRDRSPKIALAWSRTLAC